MSITMPTPGYTSMNGEASVAQKKEAQARENYVARKLAYGKGPQAEFDGFMAANRDDTARFGSMTRSGENYQNNTKMGGRRSRKRKRNTKRRKSRRRR